MTTTLKTNSFMTGILMTAAISTGCATEPAASTSSTGGGDGKADGVTAFPSSHHASDLADIVVAYGLQKGLPVTASEQTTINAALSTHHPFDVLSALGPGGDTLVGLTVETPSSIENFFATDHFTFGTKPPLVWQLAPNRDTTDVHANALAAFALHLGSPATSSQLATINQAISNGATPEVLLSELDLGAGDLESITVVDANGDQETFFATSSFSFGPPAPLEWIEVPATN